MMRDAHNRRDDMSGGTTVIEQVTAQPAVTRPDGRDGAQQEEFERARAQWGCEMGSSVGWSCLFFGASVVFGGLGNPTAALMSASGGCLGPLLASPPPTAPRVRPVIRSVDPTVADPGSVVPPGPYVRL